ncbi:MAG: hypothetical protein U0R69_00335 [Gaiellales bacterium]
MTKLTGLLAELEGTWARKGFDRFDRLRPGLAEDVVRRSLTGLPVPTEIVEWFGWHDGQVGRAEGVTLAPSAFTPLGLESAEYASLMQQAIARGADPNLVGEQKELLDPGYYWEESWLPLGEINGETWLVADLGRDSATAAVRVVNWTDEDFRSIRADSLATMVRLWLDAPDEHWAWSSPAGQWKTRPEILSSEALRSGLF